MDTASRPLVDVGDVIADRYRIDRVLGQGAMGLVLAATHLELRKPRAIKLMLRDSTQSYENVERFLREARAAAELKSQHAVKIHDIAWLPTGEPYIVMEFLEGTDLRELLKERRALPVPEAVSYLLQACEAIGEAHAAGIVHRDLKPANLFLTTGVGGAPCVKVLDFGIAKLAETQTTPDETQLTRTHVVMGSPLFMSPEQILSTRNVDRRTDIWSIGVILYGMVTGEMPFRGESAQAVFASVQRDPPPPPSIWKPDLPPGMERIIFRCLEKDPARRYASVAELAADLAPFALENARAPLPHVPKPPDVSDTQLPTQVWKSSSGGVSSNTASTPAPPDATFGSSATRAMPPASTPSPMSPHGEPIAPVAQTNSPLVQSIGATNPPRPRGRELILVGGGFALALVLVAIVMLAGRGGGSTEAKPTAAEAPPTSAQAASTNPLISALGPAPELESKPATSAAPRASATATKPPQSPATTISTATAATATATPAAATTATTKGPPVRRRDD